MSFESILLTNIEKYTDFKVDFYNENTGRRTVRGLSLPYAWAGKNTPNGIENVITSEPTNWDGDDLKSSSVLQVFVDNNEDDTGIDCSGFAYYVLNETTDDDDVMEQFDNTSYEDGVNAMTLTDTSKGTVITKAKNIVPGCLIRTNNGGHVVVVYEVEKNAYGVVTKIWYAHSNSTYTPHKASITIGDEEQDLDGSSQTWSDPGFSNPNYLHSTYNHTILLDSVESYI